MSDVELKVSLEEAVAIVNLLGSLPTAQGGVSAVSKTQGTGGADVAQTRI